MLTSRFLPELNRPTKPSLPERKVFALREAILYFKIDITEKRARVKVAEFLSILIEVWRGARLQLHMLMLTLLAHTVVTTMN